MQGMETEVEFQCPEALQYMDIAALAMMRCDGVDSKQLREIAAEARKKIGDLGDMDSLKASLDGLEVSS